MAKKRRPNPRSGRKASVGDKVVACMTACLIIENWQPRVPDEEGFLRITAGLQGTVVSVISTEFRDSLYVVEWECPEGRVCAKAWPEHFTLVA